MLAFRQPDVRGVIAYSSMGQMGLIVLGIFAVNDLGLDGAVLHSVNHGLVSAGLFLLAGMIETRTGTGVFSQLGGMAKGRPILATLVMVLGMFTLAVPGSANFAGEFAILAGVFEHGWGYAAVGAAAIVLAALYALRLISAVLHERRGAVGAEEPTISSARSSSSSCRSSRSSRCSRPGLPGSASARSRPTRRPRSSAPSRGRARAP